MKRDHIIEVLAQYGTNSLKVTLAKDSGGLVSVKYLLGMHQSHAIYLTEGDADFLEAVATTGWDLGAPSTIVVTLLTTESVEWFVGRVGPSITALFPSSGKDAKRPGWKVQLVASGHLKFVGTTAELGIFCAVAEQKAREIEVTLLEDEKHAYKYCGYDQEARWQHAQAVANALSLEDFELI